jgi:acyl-CoA synthetase (NDP forming)
VKALVHGGATTGNRMGLIAMTGGQSVVITDAFEGEGLEVPLLTAASYEKLAGFFNIIGGSYRNPLDAGGTIGMGFAPGNLQKLLDILEEDENVDAVAMEVSATFVARRVRENPALLDGMIGALAAHRERTAKPFLAIAHPGHIEDVMSDIRSRLLGRGIATFTSFQSAARAMRRVVEYWRFREGLE